VAGQQPLDRSAQQGRIVARHRRDDQQPWTILGPLAAEMLELAERLAQHDLLVNGDIPAVDDRRFEAEFRLASRRCSMGENVKGRCDDRPHVRIGEGIDRILQPARTDIGERAGPGKQRALHLIRVVKHRFSTPVRRVMGGATGLVQSRIDRPFR
jgi:hypothetical protein